MINNTYNELNHSSVLFELVDYFDFIMKLHNSNKIPKVLMLSGSKGIGKCTLVNHLMNYIFDKENYNLEKKTINEKSLFNNQYLINTFPNIVYLSGEKFTNVKIDDIRKLKSHLSKTTISNNKRFIILDDVEVFNQNSLNGLLKIIEEPSENNYFMLINNKSRPLIKTIQSRALELKIIINEKKRIKIIQSLIKKNNFETSIDYNLTSISPGNLVTYSNILNDNKIDINGDFLFNLEKTLNLYKKNKNINFANLSLFLTDLYFYKFKESKININKCIEDKSFIKENINNFFIYNLNQKALMNAINSKLHNE